MLHYFLQVLFFQLLFLMVYEMFLKKETFFNYNRAYLLLTPVLAFIIPWLRLEFLVEAVPSNARIVLPEIITRDPVIYTQNLPLIVINAQGGWEPNWWFITYAIGALISSILFFRKYSYLKNLFRSGRKLKEENLRIVEVPDSAIACTFFNTVLLGDQLSEEERHQILAHELVHVEQKHSYDLIFFEIMKILFWFNPLIYIYQSRIAGLHEFIADSEVVKKIPKKTYFEQMLNSAFSTKDISFTSQFFNHSLIKKRIIMLQKDKSRSITKFKFLVIIPLMLAMLTYVACSENTTEIGATDSSIPEFGYTLTKGKEMTTQNKAAHTKYEDFLLNNPDYVSWATIEADQITYSIHPAGEEVPSGYRKMEVSFPDGDSYIMYMNLQPGSSEEKRPHDMKPIKIDNDLASQKEVPFGLIDQVPVFPECKGLASGEEQKDCVSRKISMFVNKNFDTSLGKKLGLTGINRVIVQFRIDETGNITDIKSRGPHPELERESERVIASLPKMEPGKHRGKKVSVMYSLPIAFKVGE
ncbi:M56 family metallopeptidase [Christiangramia crocea]|uniref:M56 family metallopeptidase n=1 Tax=Christiangramia crocea TaxID=2904124 RepID=A0A9X2A787_9FLAO|nr:M56 family metallopeptidase [Gramella crocea]MCG9971641.1 M56 family metallopeptidase [Gramella crocea]